MPTNMFGNSDLLRQRAVSQMGMDVPRMIQQQWQEAQSRFAEQEQMGRKKFAQDLLEEELKNAAQELQNRQFGYRFGQEQDYYNFLKTPEGQQAFAAYREMAHGPNVGPLIYPQQIKDVETLQAQEDTRRHMDKQVAAGMLERYVPRVDPVTKQLLPDPPDILWARQVMGIPTAAKAVGKEETGATTPAAAPRYNALETFLHEAVPPLVGGGTAAAVASRIPNPAVSIPVGIGTYFLGDKIARMASGELTSAERAAHPTAAQWGDIAGKLGATVMGGRGIVKKYQGETPGNMTMAQRLYSSMKRMMPGGRTPPLQPGQARMRAGYPGIVPPQQTVRPPPSMSNVPGPGAQGEFPPASPPGTVVPPRPPPSMSNVPGPVSEYLGPMSKDPAVMKLLQQLFKKKPISSGLPPGLP